MGVLFDEYGGGASQQAPQAPQPGAAPAAAPAPQQEAAPPLAAQPEEPSLFQRVASDVGNGALEILPALGRGVEKGLNEVSSTAFDVAKWADRYVPMGQVSIDKSGIHWRSGFPDKNNLQIPDNAMIPAPSTVTGGVAEGLSQFLTGYVLGGKLLKGVGMTAGRLGIAAGGGGAVGDAAAALMKGMETEGGKLTYAGARSMFSGAAAFDPSEARLSNIIQSDTPIANAITGYLAADPTDSRAEGRFKNALEQLALAVPAEALFYAVKGIKLKRAGDLDGAAKASEKAGKIVEDASAEKPAETPSASPEASTAAPGEQPAASPNVPEIDFGKAPKGPRTTLRKPGNDYDPAPEKLSADGTKVEPYKPPFEWDQGKQDELVKQFAQVNGDPAKLSDLAQQRITTNMARVADENDAKALFNQFGKLSYDAFVKAKGGKVTLDDVANFASKAFEDLSDATGTDMQQLILKMNADKANLEQLAERVAGYRMGTQMYANRATKLAQAYLKGDFSEFGGDAEAFKREALANAQTLYAIAPLTEGIKSNLGRNLSLLRAKVGPDGAEVGKLAKVGEDGKPVAPEAAKPAEAGAEAPKPAAETPAAVAKAKTPEDLMQALGGDQAAFERLMRKLALADTPKLAKKVVDDAFGPKLMDIHNEYWINALLSGPKTHVVNMVTAAIKSALVMPSEQMLAGVISRDMATFRMGADQYAGMLFSLKDAWKAAGKALRVGDAIMDQTHMGLSESKSAITAANFGLDTSTPLGAFTSGLGEMIRLPSRLLTSEDEFMKQLNYRGRMYAQAMREARGNKIAKDEIGQYVAEYMERGFSPEGKGINEQAVAYARDATFTNALKAETWTGGRSLGETVNSFAANHPGLRLILPFTRVPTNIMRDAWDHTPIMNYTRRQFRAELEAGGERAALAKAKLATGTAMWSTAIAMAANGDITGALSSDPHLARMEQEAGKQANSFRFFDENGKPYYVQYNRLDPYATFFSLAATVADIGGHIEDWRLDDLAGSMVTALAKNLESKTYLQGLTNVLSALADPDERGPSFIRRQMASYIPSMTATFRGSDYLGDPHTVATAMADRMPGHGKVDPKYNLLGERVATPQAWGPDWLSPMALSPSDKQDPTLQELARLAEVHKGGLGYMSRQRGNIDLSQIDMNGQSAYGRAQELTGQVQIGGQTLRQRLSSLFNSDYYKNTLKDGEPRYEGSRLAQVQAIIQGYREGALGQLQKESPAYAQAYRDDQVKKLNTLRFGPQQ